MFQILLNILFYTSLYLLLSLSISIIYFPTKFFHLAHAGVIALGAYFVFMVSAGMGMPLYIAVLSAAALATAVGMGCEVLVYKPMRKRGYPPLAFLIASIGIYVVLQNLISLFFGDDTKVIRTGEVTVGHEIFGAYITTVQIVTIVVSLVLFTGVNLFLKHTETGKAMSAVSSNAFLANIFGINSDRVILISFAVGSALGAIAGILSAMDTNMTPTFGFNLLLYGVIAMIIGGVGSTSGLVWGSLLVASAQHVAAYYIDTKWIEAVAFMILIVFLIWRPLGFSGNKLKKVEI